MSPSRMLPVPVALEGYKIKSMAQNCMLYK